MTTYKITNLTGGLGKRDNSYNKTLDITYVDNMERKTMHLKPNDTIYFTTNTIPTSIHNLRVRGLISVVEISDKQLINIQSGGSKTNKITPQVKSTTTTTTTNKKRTTTSTKKTQTKTSKNTESSK